MSDFVRAAIVTFLVFTALLGVALCDNQVVSTSPNEPPAQYPAFAGPASTSSCKFKQTIGGYIILACGSPDVRLCNVEDEKQFIRITCDKAQLAENPDGGSPE
jgi:hypothetical protein